MNTQKLMFIGIPLALVLVGWLYFTRVDRSDPVAVANAFTAALKNGNTSKASSYYLPDRAAAWREAMDASLETMKSGASHTFFDAIPATPAFVAVPAAAGKPANADQMSLKDPNGYILELSRDNGKWYVSKAPSN